MQTIVAETRTLHKVVSAVCPADDVASVTREVFAACSDGLVSRLASLELSKTARNAIANDVGYLVNAFSEMEGAEYDSDAIINFTQTLF
jgi:hypothetical protein